VLADWDPDMTVGVAALDAHHRQVWRRVRHLANAVAEASGDELRGSLRLLYGYLAEHDAEEERAMDAAGYPGAREHARAHAAIRERIAAAREDAGAGAARRLLEVAEWAARVLAAHMKGDDLRLGRFLTARENLRRLAEAEPGVGVSLTPVPGSLTTPIPGADPAVARKPATAALPTLTPNPGTTTAFARTPLPGAPGAPSRPPVPGSAAAVSPTRKPAGG
jgi:hemerythrin